MTGWALGDTTDDTDADTGNATEPTAVVVGFGNYVWVDENRNGRQDPDEPPLAGVVVWLLDASGTPVLARSQRLLLHRRSAARRLSRPVRAAVWLCVHDHGWPHRAQ